MSDLTYLSNMYNLFI